MNHREHETRESSASAEDAETYRAFVVVPREPTIAMSAAGMRYIKSIETAHFQKFAGGIANSVYDNRAFFSGHSGFGPHDRNRHPHRGWQVAPPQPQARYRDRWRTP